MHERLEAGDYDALADYYRAASRMLHERTWADQREREIWRLHSEGVSYTRAVRVLRREHPRWRVGRRRIRETVQRLRDELLGLRRRRGRRKDPHGRGAGCERIVVRLNEDESRALALVQASLPGRSRADIVRLLLRELCAHVRA